MTEKKKGTWGGRREGAGRPATGKSTKCYPVRLEVEDYEKLKRLGGAKWIREQIQNANERGIKMTREEYKKIVEKAKEELREKLWDEFESFKDAEIVAGCAAYAETTVNGLKFEVTTDPTDFRLEKDATQAEIDKMLEELVEAALNRNVKDVTPEEVWW